MIRSVLIFVLTTLLYKSGQSQKQGYFSFGLGANFAQVYDPVIGVHLSGNGEIGKGFFAGIEIGAVKFQEFEGVYLPLQLKFTVAPKINTDKVSPLIVLAPGYGVYNKAVRVGSINITNQGGMVFYGGLGLAFPGKGKSRGYLTLGYSMFGFTTNEIKSYAEMIGLRAGVMLR